VASFLASALAGAGALAAGLASSFLAGAAGAWANADTANADTMIAITDFILKFPLCYTQKIFPAYIYNALARTLVDKKRLRRAF
jgi:hypothetical protein